MNKHIIFDLDGTLLNTLTDLACSTNYALKECGYPTHTNEEIRQMVGNGVANLIHRAMPQNADEAEFNKCFAIFKSHYKLHCMDKTEPYEGIMPLLEKLKAKGAKMAIVSNKLDSAVKELNAQFFNEYINVAIGETENIQRKPAPDMVLKAIEQLGVQPNDCVYIGDSDVDIITARNAGIPCISVLWGFRDIDFLKEHGATTFARTPNEIYDILNS